MAGDGRNTKVQSCADLFGVSGYNGTKSGDVCDISGDFSPDDVRAALGVGASRERSDDLNHENRGAPCWCCARWRRAAIGWATSTTPFVTWNAWVRG